MTVTYTWTIDSLVAEDDGALTNVVKIIHYRCAGTDGTHSADYYGAQRAGEAGEPYTAWADLTPEIIKGWLPAAVISQAEASVKAQIDALAAASAKNKIVGVPW